MATVTEIYQYLDTLAPFSIQMDFDNSGFLVGRGEAEVSKIMVALDITEAVITEALEMECQLIVSHHPIIFHPAKQITDQEPIGRCLFALIENHLAAICAHTNLDAVAGGVNDALAQALHLQNIQLLEQAGMDPFGRPYGIGRIGTLEQPIGLMDFGKRVKRTLNSPDLRLIDAGKPVFRVAVGGGSCAELYPTALALNCDTMVTADISYHTFLDAKAIGINLIDAGHFSTENVICPILADWLSKGFPTLQVICSKSHKEVFSCL